MQTTPITLVTVIAEGVLEERLIQQLHSLGARGHTRTEVRGHGTRGITDSFWDGPQIKIETLVSAEVADRILTHLAAHYFADYAVVAYAQPVNVVRGDKYS